ncbi:BON domain-containing protein [Phytohalomonas tamaricis]|uniref:BON domain-containing protein n=1 Tax=Phytohalomonas tamaricis TaxID=2081032 RepID=UPI000D0AD53C|nr:BON domain-containing protein [Phytohalomonas tamaricis]
MLKSYFSLALLGLVLATSGCASFSGSSQPNSGVRTESAAAQDSTIRSTIFQTLGSRDARFNDAHVNVDAWNGYVLLSGQVPSQELKDKAEQIARNTANVRKVHNALSVAANTSTTQRLRDSWLTTRITTNFVTSNTIDSDRVNVVTENNVVYLMGILHDYEVQNVVNTAAQVGGVQKVVKVFEYTQ